MAKPLTWHTEQRIVEQLIPYESNPRKLTEEQQKALDESLNKFNLVEIPAINLDNRIIAGHMRVLGLIAKGRGKESIDVRVPNRKLTEKEFQEYNIRSNKNTGEWDFDILASAFGKSDLLSWGFTDFDLNAILIEPTGDDLIGDEKAKPPILKITFTSPEQLQAAESDIQELLDRKYKGAFYSVSAGEL